MRFQIYANREVKMDFYSMEDPNYDPLPKFKAINQSVPLLTDDQFHDMITELFNGLRDLHVWYFPPGKGRCYAAMTGLVFDLASSVNEISPRAVVSKKNPDVNAVMGRAYSTIRVGDELLEFDNMPLLTLAEKWKKENSGANDFGKIRYLLDSISIRWGTWYEMPQSDTFTLKMRSWESDDIYTVTLPWAVEIDTECLDVVNSMLQPTSQATVSSKIAALKKNRPFLFPGSLKKGVRCNFWSEYKKEKQKVKRMQLIDTEEPCMFSFLVHNLIEF